jgi:hypothetical protein
MRKIIGITPIKIVDFTEVGCYSKVRKVYLKSKLFGHDYFDFEDRQDELV